MKITEIKDLVKGFLSRETERQRKVKAVAKWLQDKAEIFEALDVEPEITYDVQGVDFNYLSHEKTVEVMRAVKAGTWTKSYNSDTINYATKINGFQVRIYNGAPPPNCKIVEEEVIEPAYSYPEQKVMRRRIVCDETVAEG